MSGPSRISAYALEYSLILKLAVERGSFTVPVDSVADAKGMRARIYAYVTALERSPDAEKQEAALVYSNIGILVRPSEDGGGLLILERRDKMKDAVKMREALAREGIEVGAVGGIGTTVDDAPQWLKDLAAAQGAGVPPTVKPNGDETK